MTASKPYENTEGCWNYLCEAGKYARHLGLVDPGAFVDRRNPEPHIHMLPATGEPPGWEHDFPEWWLPKIRADLSAGIDLEMPKAWTVGYEYDDLLQPYHVEAWCEKSTMNDELLPLCRRHAVNLVTGMGEMSVTSVIELLRRMARLGKPCRLLYVSDFDPAGDGMPVSVARKVEHVVEGFPDADVKLDPLILTRAQVEGYGLPRKPIKDSEGRKANFEALHGEGAVELDALEALYPGELARIVEERVREFRDEGLSEKVDLAHEEAEGRLAEVLDERLAPHEAELEELREGIAAVAETYQERLEELDDALQAELEPYRARLEALRLAVQNGLVGAEPGLPDLPEPETAPEREGWLFDGRRGYFEQLAAYKEHQNGAGGAA